jgi:hypothetical protein
VEHPVPVARVVRGAAADAAVVVDVAADVEVVV